jgi:outer membrane protein OmpA-like peptidoglycan-associated protein
MVLYWKKDIILTRGCNNGTPLGNGNPIVSRILSDMEQLNQWTQVLKRKTLITSLTILISFLWSMTASAQENYHKLNQRYHRAYYKKNESRLVNACRILDKKRNYTPRRSVFAAHRRPKANTSAQKSIVSNPKSDLIASAAEIKPVAKPVIKPVVKSLPIKPKIEHISEEKLVKLHKKEDEVLAINHLPVPTSQKHEEVRKKVADKLASKENVYPLSLAPLYFQFNQDEFSVVDMEPFLMAAEYALQGRTLLVEGHTDNRGMDDFNVKLSIKRVQKIRQLMLDMGVPDERISVVGYGEELGKEKVKNENDHQNNRRVDFTIF